MSIVGSKMSLAQKGAKTMRGECKAIEREMAQAKKPYQNKPVRRKHEEHTGKIVKRLAGQITHLKREVMEFHEACSEAIHEMTMHLNAIEQA